jgi:phosphoribosyl 1,2-cyclic phosphodiesterase
VNVTVLGSGSSGNSTLIEAGDVRLLIDAGFSGRDLERRLRAADVEPVSVTALLVTHDHGDHTRGMGVFARRWRVPLYLTQPTRRACARLLDGTEEVRSYRAAEALQVGGLRIEPFLTVHDAVDPIAVTVTEVASGDKLGIATDLGRPTSTVRHALQHCHLLILEANHDEILLRECAYPWSVKTRIGGSHGHLSNRAAAELATELYHERLGRVVLAHLSEQANHPGMAAEAVGLALERRRFRGAVSVALQNTPLETIDVSALRLQGMPPQLALF